MTTESQAGGDRGEPLDLLGAFERAQAEQLAWDEQNGIDSSSGYATPEERVMYVTHEYPMPAVGDLDERKALSTADQELDG